MKLAVSFVSYLLFQDIAAPWLDVLDLAAWRWQGAMAFVTQKVDGNRYITRRLPFRENSIQKIASTARSSSATVSQHNGASTTSSSALHSSFTMSTPVDLSDEDIYGQRHPIETPDLIAAKLKELAAEIDKLPEDDKKGWQQALEKCPDLVDDDFKLMFLRCEVFNADLAATRLVKYWDKRIFLFGSTKAFQPLRLKLALKDDDAALEMGFGKLIPTKDTSGRTVVFVDPSCQDKSKYSRESMTRALWYIMHVALEENVDSQKMGIVILGYPHHVKLEQFDRTQMKMNMESIRGCLPVRISAFHFCHPPKIFSIIFPVIKLFLGERLRKRIKVHAGDNEKVINELAEYGMNKDLLPSELGGNFVFDHSNWIFQRKESDL